MRSDERKSQRVRCVQGMMEDGRKDIPGTMEEKIQREREREMYIPGVMEAPAAIYILSAISTSDMFSTSSVKACTSSNDIPSCTMMVEICTHH